MRLENTSLAFTRPGLDTVVKLYAKTKRRFYTRFTTQTALGGPKGFYRVATEGDFTPASQVTQGEAIDFQDLQTPYYMDLYPVKRAIGFSAAQELTSSDLYGLMASRGPKMVEAIERSMEYDAANFLNLGSSSVLTPDGLSFFNSAHLLQTGTASNILSGNPVLSITALAAAKSALFQQVSHTSQPMAYTGNMLLLVHPDNYDLAYRLCNTEGGRQPQSGADSDKNWGGMDVIPFQNPYFTSSTAWALVMEGAENPMKVVVRQGLRTNEQPDINHDGTLYTATKIWVKGAFDWRGIVYSAGA
jgi:hypothetical protein